MLLIIYLIKELSPIINEKILLSLLLSSIPPTSNFVERCFSVAWTTNGQERHSLLSITLEMVLFLRQNGESWTAQTVNEAI
ncbi:hypothetical protein JG687_00014675, partial [Phytophthora cactorum]